MENIIPAKNPLIVFFGPKIGSPFIVKPKSIGISKTGTNFAKTGAVFANMPGNVVYTALPIKIKNPKKKSKEVFL
jgi:hypothetical protein